MHYLSVGISHCHLLDGRTGSKLECFVHIQPFFVVILLQVNCNDYNSTVWLFYSSVLFVNVMNINSQPIANVGCSNITSLPMPVPEICQELSFVLFDKEENLQQPFISVG